MQQGNNRRYTGIVIAVVLVVLVIAILALVFNRNNVADEAGQNDTANQNTTEQQAEDEDSLLARITENPDSYVGQTVTVEGEVQDVLSNRIFKISEDMAGDELTVLSREALSSEQAAEAEEFLQDNANARVAGTVVRATAVEVERDYDIDLDAGVEVEFENKVVLVANSITFTDRNGSVWEFNNDAGSEGGAQE